jgi:hypothetical protein
MVWNWFLTPFRAGLFDYGHRDEQLGYEARCPNSLRNNPNERRCLFRFAQLRKIDSQLHQKFVTAFLRQLIVE